MDKGKGKGKCSDVVGAAGGGHALPPGPVPDLSASEALASPLVAPKPKDDVVPPQQRVQQVAADINKKERKLEHEFAKLCRLRSELEDQKNLALQC
eukprot:1842003-Pyramimonas_sp.AAC.1